MRKHKFISVIFFMALLVGVLSPTRAIASTISKKTNPIQAFGNIEAEAIDSVTGTVKKLEIKKIDKTDVNYQLAASDGQEPIKTVTYKVVASVPNSSSDVITPDDTESGSKTTDVTATLSIDYQLRNDEIRIDRVYGSWIPSSEFLVISKREVDYGDGDPYTGHVGIQHPSSNSFNYTTGWPYVLKYPETSIGGPRAATHATVSLELSSHPIDLVVKIS